MIDRGTNESTVRLAVALPADSAVLARLHALAHEAPWGVEAFDSLLSQPGYFAIMALAPDAAGFILVRVVADEAEILTLAVAPERQRLGIGRRLIDASLEEVQSRGASRYFLEVAADNAPAIALYQSTSFRRHGQRTGYYSRPSGAVDALLFARTVD